MANILSISYDDSLLLTRQLLLQQMGHIVHSAAGFSRAYKLCADSGSRFDLIVLGHSIPHDDKIEIVQHCTNACNMCPVLALLRSGEAPIPGAARSVDSSDPEAFMAAIHEIVGTNGSIKQGNIFRRRPSPADVA